MRKALLLLPVLFLLAGAPAAWAAPDAAGAAALKKSVENGLVWYLSVSKATGQGLGIKGDVTVAPGAQYYEIRLPGVYVLSGFGYRLDVGDVVVNATPGENGEWLLSAALPVSMPVYDAADKPVADLSIGRQRLSAAWAPAEDLFSRYDVEYHDITLKSRKPGFFAAAVGGASARQNLVRNADGSWTGPNIYAADKIDVKISDRQDVSLRLDKLSSRTEYQRVSLDSRRLAKEKIRALIAGHKSDLSEAQMRAAMVGIVNESTTLPDSFTGGFEAEGLLIDGRPVPGAADQAPVPAQQVTLHKFSAVTSMTGMKQARGAISFKASLDGLKITGLPGVTGALIPYVGNVDARIENLPMERLTKAALAITAAAARDTDNPVEKQKAAQEIQAILGTLPQALAGAGTTIAVRDSYLRTEDVNAALEAQLAANAASPMVAAGTVTLTAGGLDEMIRKYQSTTAPGAAAYAQMLTPVDILGQLQKGADGKSLRVYKIDLTPEGKMLLNGLDITMVQQMMSAGMRK